MDHWCPKCGGMLGAMQMTSRPAAVPGMGPPTAPKPTQAGLAPPQYTDLTAASASGMHEVQTSVGWNSPITPGSSETFASVWAQRMFYVNQALMQAPQVQQGFNASNNLAGVTLSIGGVHTAVEMQQWLASTFPQGPMQAWQWFQANKPTPPAPNTLNMFPAWTAAVQWAMAQEAGPPPAYGNWLINLRNQPRPLFAVALLGKAGNLGPTGLSGFTMGAGQVGSPLQATKLPAANLSINTGWNDLIPGTNGTWLNALVAAVKRLPFEGSMFRSTGTYGGPLKPSYIDSRIRYFIQSRWPTVSRWQQELGWIDDASYPMHIMFVLWWLGFDTSPRAGHFSPCPAGGGWDPITFGCVD